MIFDNVHFIRLYLSSRKFEFQYHQILFQYFHLLLEDPKYQVQEQEMNIKATQL